MKKMNEKFDPLFEKMRMDKLAIQCLSGLDISGEVIFDCITQNNESGVSSWYFDDDAYSQLNHCGYKSFLIRLIEDLSIYRLKFNQKNYQDGIVSIEGISTVITWLPDGQSAKLREEKFNDS